MGPGCPAVHEAGSLGHDGLCAALIPPGVSSQAFRADRLCALFTMHCRDEARRSRVRSICESLLQVMGPPCLLMEAEGRPVMCQMPLAYLRPG